MGTPSIRVLVVDDSEPWRNFFSNALRKRPELNIIGQVSDGLEAVQQAQTLQPDLILLDIGLPTLNGIEAARRIRKVSPGSKILFVSENRSVDIAEEALSTGAGGYVVKSDAASQLLPAVKALLEGKRFVSASLSSQDLMTSHTEASEGGHRIENNPYMRFARSALVSELLSSVIDATAADFCTIQLFDSTNRVLKIVAQHGFESEFLNYFSTVTDNAECVCGSAMNSRSRIVITDVATDPLFPNETRGVLLRANVRSVQSTPLIDSFGKVVGMLSTHYSCLGPPSLHALKQVDDFAACFLAKIK
jgi:DNA-binding NarL/FixJ family response regulator